MFIVEVCEKCIVAFCVYVCYCVDDVWLGSYCLHWARECLQSHQTATIFCR